VYPTWAMFSGLIETMGESHQFPILDPRRGEMERSGLHRRPTCDSADIMYENYKYGLR